jgi:hypothetical protein
LSPATSCLTSYNSVLPTSASHFWNGHLSRPTQRSLSLPDNLRGSIFCFIAVIFLRNQVNIHEHFSLCNPVIRKWSHAISKYNEATPGRFCFPKITFKMQITDYLASANSPIHTLHFEPGSLWCVYLLCTNCEQQNTVNDIFSISQQLGARLWWVIWFVLPRVPLSVPFIQKRVTGFKEISYPFERVKKVPVKIHPEISACSDMGESRICLADVLPAYSIIKSLYGFGIKYHT